MKNYGPQFDELFDKLSELEIDLRKDYYEWQKASPQCPPNDARKSPNVEPNASTNSNAPMNTIPLQVPKQHKNAMLTVVKDPLTSRHELVYSYEDSQTGIMGTVKFVPETDSSSYIAALREYEDLATPPNSKTYPLNPNDIIFLKGA